MNYNNKYLKYKKKYNDLKLKQKGGKVYRCENNSDDCKHINDLFEQLKQVELFRNYSDISRKYIIFNIRQKYFFENSLDSKNIYDTFIIQFFNKRLWTTIKSLVPTLIKKYFKKDFDNPDFEKLVIEYYLTQTNFSEENLLKVKNLLKDDYLFNNFIQSNKDLKLIWDKNFKNKSVEFSTYLKYKALYQEYEYKEKNKIYIVVPGNAGQPGGGYGFPLYNKWYSPGNPQPQSKQDFLQYISTTEISLRNLDIFKPPLEEQIMRKWMYGIEPLQNDKDKSLYCSENKIELDDLKKIEPILKTSFSLNTREDADNLYKKLNLSETAINILKTGTLKQKIEYKKIATKWGLYETEQCIRDVLNEHLTNKSIIKTNPIDDTHNKCLLTKTIQTNESGNVIDYTSTSTNANKYNLCFKIDDINIDNINVNLLFTFAPNYSNGKQEANEEKNQIYKPYRPTMKATVDPHKDDIDYTKEAIINCISACLEKVEDGGYILLPHLGSGVNQCFLTKHKTPQAERNAYYELVHEVLKTSDKKKLNVYVIFFDDDSS